MALMDSLSKFEGIEGVVVSKSSGELDFHTGTESPDMTASVAAVAVQSMADLGGLLGVGKFSHFVIKGGDTAVVAEKEERIAAVSLRGTADAAALAECLRNEAWTFAPATAAKRPLPPPLPLATPKDAPAVSRLRRTPVSTVKREAVKREAVKREAPQAASIPPTPEAQSLKRLRAALYFGDISACMPIAKEILHSDGRSGLSSQETESFSSRLGTLSGVVRELLEGSLDAAEHLDAFTAEENTDDSLLWAAHIWSARLRLALGDIGGAEASALAAYHSAHAFDSDTRTATRCTFAEVYILAGQVDKALKLLAAGASAATRCHSETILASMHLTEAHARAMKRQFAQSDQAAKAAEGRIPQSPYPKLMRARLAAMVGNSAKARSLYQGVLGLNPTQPDALAELKILARVKDGSLTGAAAAVYFHHRELAPTEECIKALKGLTELPTGFPEAAGLLAWRLIGIGDVGTMTPAGFSTDRGAHRYKPNVVLGYGASCSIAVGYQALLDKLAFSQKAVVVPQDISKGDLPPTLSLPPSELREHMAGLSADSLFSGELKMFSLPDLLEFLRNAHRTGSLLCSSPEGVGAVEMVDGYVSSAIAPEVDTIGAILLRDKMISKEDLTEAAKQREKDLAGLRIGAILVEKGLVNAETIKKAITEQTFASIETMLSWNEGRFLFTPRVESDVDRTKVEVKLDSQFLLMELFRRQDEASNRRPPCSEAGSETVK